MEVTVTGNRFGYQLTEAARHLIEQIVVLDSASRADKEVLFEQLYELWNQDLVIGITKAKERFNENAPFIKDIIFHSLSAIDQENFTLEEKIYENIKHGFKYTLPDNREIQSNLTTIKKFQKKTKNNREKITRRFNRLLEDFLEYVDDKIHSSILYALVLHTLYLVLNSTIL